jgi:hypothetical protein
MAILQWPPWVRHCVVKSLQTLPRQSGYANCNIGKHLAGEIGNLPLLDYKHHNSPRFPPVFCVPLGKHGDDACVEQER